MPNGLKIALLTIGKMVNLIIGKHRKRALYQTQVY